jgi:multiple sugar transport system ATP-binding protein
MKVSAQLTEELGSEVNVIFEIDAPQVTHDAARALAENDGDEENTVAVESGHSLWTARVDPHTSVKAGSPVTLAVDTTALHFFNPESGLAIGRR